MLICTKVCVYIYIYMFERRKQTWLIELAAQEARPVPKDDTKNMTGSKGTGAIAKPAAAVVTTRAEITKVIKRKETT